MIRRGTFRLWIVVVWLLVSVTVGESNEPAVEPDRLGAGLDHAGTQVTFRVFSSRATRVEVWVYDQPFGEAEKGKFEMTVDPTTKIWSKTVPVADLASAGECETIHYGYRAWGANWPFDAAWTNGSHAGFISDVDAQGNRFNPNKLLLDPYALEVSHDARSARLTSDAIFLSGPQRDQDTGAAAPKGLVLRPSPADATAKPTRAIKDEVIYEVHLRGLTKNDPSVPDRLRGTNSKQNAQPWPFGPSDGGSDNNIAWDQGGDAALQRQAARNGLAFLMLSAGVPMITGGDEMYRTQFGNNNAYNLDSEKNHLDWENVPRFPRFLDYTKKLIAFRRAHAALRPAEFFQGRDSNNNGRKDITWFRDSGDEADGGYLDNAENHFLAFRLDGTELGDSATSLYVAYNGWSGEVTATLPANTTGHRWFRVADTDQWMEDQDNFEAPGAEEPLDHSTYKLHPRSVLVLIEK